MPSQCVITNSEVGAKFCFAIEVCADWTNYCLLNIMFASCGRAGCSGGGGGGVIVVVMIVVIIIIVGGIIGNGSCANSSVIIIISFNRWGDV